MEASCCLGCLSGFTYPSAVTRVLLSILSEGEFIMIPLRTYILAVSLLLFCLIIFVSAPAYGDSASAYSSPYPSSSPTMYPSASPTGYPSSSPTMYPSASPTPQASPQPSESPSPSLFPNICTYWEYLPKKITLSYMGCKTAKGSIRPAPLSLIGKRVHLTGCSNRGTSAGVCEQLVDQNYNDVLGLCDEIIQALCDNGTLDPAWCGDSPPVAIGINGTLCKRDSVSYTNGECVDVKKELCDGQEIPGLGLPLGCRVAPPGKIMTCVLSNERKGAEDRLCDAHLDECCIRSGKGYPYGDPDGFDFIE